MAPARSAGNVRNTIAIMFTIFLLINAVAQTVAVIGGLRQTSMIVTPFNEDTPPALRLILFLIGMGLSWILARILYKFMVRGKISVDESTNTSYVLMFYFLLLFATLSFLNVINWFWLPVLFLVLLVYTIFTLWSLVGGLKAAVAGVVTLMAIIFTLLLVS